MQTSNIILVALVVALSVWLLLVSNRNIREQYKKDEKNK